MRPARVCARACVSWLWAELEQHANQTPGRCAVKRAWDRERERLGRRAASALKPARAPQFSHSSRAARGGNDARALFALIFRH